MTRPRILVVDDSPVALAILQAALEGEDYDVLTAGDALEALTSMKASRPDLVVTDNIMPGLDGFALVRRMKADAATRLIPVVMITAANDDGEPQEAGVQPDAVVRKSIETAPLLARIRDLLARRPASIPT